MKAQEEKIAEVEYLIYESSRSIPRKGLRTVDVNMLMNEFFNWHTTELNRKMEEVLAQFNNLSIDLYKRGADRGDMSYTIASVDIKELVEDLKSLLNDETE